jgi:hypothetical protein
VTFLAPLVRVTVEERRTTVCRVEIDETTTSVIIGCTVVLVADGGTEVIVVLPTLDGVGTTVIVDPGML